MMVRAMAAIGLFIGMNLCGNAFAQPAEETKTAKIIIRSDALPDGGMMPRRHTRGGENLSPSLVWSGIPDGTKTLALICDDPDAPNGTWTHWVIFNIPANRLDLREAVPLSPKLKDGTCQGLNDFGDLGYSGPYPPNAIHRYFFRIYALDTRLDLAPRSDKKALVRAMEGHILGTGEVMVRSNRQ